MIEPQEKIISAAYKEGQQLALDIAKTLGLPEHLISFELKLAHDSLPIIKCDATVIKTIARANPTLYLLKQGTVIRRLRPKRGL